MVVLSHLSFCLFIFSENMDRKQWSVLKKKRGDNLAGSRSELEGEEREV